jgi:hypothetical protein
MVEGSAWKLPKLCPQRPRTYAGGAKRSKCSGPTRVRARGRHRMLAVTKRPDGGIGDDRRANAANAAHLWARVRQGPRKGRYPTKLTKLTLPRARAPEAAPRPVLGSPPDCLRANLRECSQ